jgi:glyoxylase-like metal-dependent hydrolase (beta-lactamase superfamily II)
MQIAAPSDWFRVTDVGDGITLVEEPHVDPLLSANIWHIRGRDRDLVVDAGLGVVPLRRALPWLFEHDPVLVLSHSHLDHMGGAHEFDDVCVHTAEVSLVSRPGPVSLHGPTLVRQLGMEDDGSDLPELLLNRLPDTSYDPDSYALVSVPAVRSVVDGEVVDLGDRQLTVLHLPGHTPGSVALLDADAGRLFTGDVVYAEGLIDTCTGSDIADYVHTMQRLHDVDFTRVFPGHDRILDRSETLAVASAYLASKA